MYKKLDFHVHIGVDKDDIGKYSLRQLSRAMERENIREAAVFPFDEKYMFVEEASLKLRESVNEAGLPLYPFLRFDPKDMRPERLERRLDGFYGVKLHPRAQDFDPLDEKFFPLYQVISDSEKPLLIHTRHQCPHDNPRGLNPNMNPDLLVDLARHFPRMNLVIAHFGNGSIHVQDEMKKYPNIYLETSILGSTATTIKMAADYVGADRILFGSDAPYSKHHAEYEKITDSTLKRKDKEKILYHNAAGLLGI